MSDAKVVINLPPLRVLGDAVLGPVLDVFAKSGVWAAVGPGPLGDCGGLRKESVIAMR